MESSELVKEYLGYIEHLKADGVRIKYKDESFLNRKSLIKYFGWYREWFEDYNSTFANTIYLARDFDLRPTYHKLAVLKHEYKHVLQYRACGLGSAKLGLPVLFLLYLLPVPVFFAWGRWCLERSAYLETLKIWKRYASMHFEWKLDHCVEMMVNGEYGYTLAPFFRNYIRRWYEKRLG